MAPKKWKRWKRRSTIKLVDWKRNNKIAIRNFNESCDTHDLIKMELVRMLRRSFPSADAVPIYTEFDSTQIEPDNPSSFADVWLRDGNGGIYVWEIQKDINHDWLDKISKKHENVTLIIVDLKQVEKDWEMFIKNGRDPTTALREALKNYVI